MLARWGHLEDIPADPGGWDVTVRGAAKLAATLRDDMEHARLFKDLATLRVDRTSSPVPTTCVGAARRRGFAAICAGLDAVG